jgi:hypothetical protein
MLKLHVIGFYIVCLLMVSFTACKSDKGAEESGSEVTESGVDQSAAEFEAKRIITNGSLGGFKLGSDYTQIGVIADRWAIEPKERELEDGTTEPYYDVKLEDGTHLLQLERQYSSSDNTYTNNVAGIRIFDPSFKTADGVKVGMTVKDFLVKYPETRFYYSYLGDLFWMEVDQFEDINFVLEPNGFNGDRFQLGRREADKLSSDKFNPGTKIEHIFMYQSN